MCLIISDLPTPTSPEFISLPSSSLFENNYKPLMLPMWGYTLVQGNLPVATPPQEK